MTIQFNWYEIWEASNGDDKAIITLTYALTQGYNVIIASSEEMLRRRLNLTKIPKLLFKNGVLEKTPEGVKTLFSIKEPQCYFKNTEWLVSAVKVKFKVEYLKILSLRPLNSNKLFVPTEYLDQVFVRNPFLKQKDHKIWFIKEPEI